MSLGDAEIELLEDCRDDWRGLWELLWPEPRKPVEVCIDLVAPLIREGYLTTIHLSDWKNAREAVPMPLNQALAAALVASNYEPPKNIGDMFYLLSITDKGEAAIEAKYRPDL